MEKEGEGDFARALNTIRNQAGACAFAIPERTEAGPDRSVAGQRSGHPPDIVRASTSSRLEMCASQARCLALESSVAWGALILGGSLPRCRC